MRKIKLYIATSLDGFIADMDGGLDWLTAYPNPEQSDYGYRDFYNTVDILIMGGSTYQSIVDMDIPWPYADKQTYVISRTKKSISNIVEVVGEDIVSKVAEWKSTTGKDIWLVGGGEAVSLFLNNNLVDAMEITAIPTLLGIGIPLFPTVQKASNWAVTDVIKHSNGVVTTHYKIEDENKAVK